MIPIDTDQKSILDKSELGLIQNEFLILIIPRS